MQDTRYLFVILAAALFTLFSARTRPAPARALLLADAFGLAVFTIIGAQIAEEAGLPAILIVFMGTLTGVAGGVVRDVLCGEVPLILRRDTGCRSTEVPALLGILLLVEGTKSVSREALRR